MKSDIKLEGLLYFPMFGSCKGFCFQPNLFIVVQSFFFLSKYVRLLKVPHTGDTKSLIMYGQ